MRLKVLVLTALFPLALYSQTVDLERYMGTWYEVARYENGFQKNCLATKVDYKLSNSKKSVKVKNTCFKKDNPEKQQVARGRAFVTDSSTNSKLKVSFVPFFKLFGWFAGPYWILSTGFDYDFAVVGHPEKKYLWILSRKPELPRYKLLKALYIAKRRGYDIKKLKMTPVWEN